MDAAENITVLFTDLVGSTELASSLTPEAGDELRREHFATLRSVVEEVGGREIKNLGDGIMVVFPIASAALSCSVAMQQAVDRDNRQSARALALRIGLSGGEATREGDDYFGDPVVEAARLCAHAVGGQILAGDTVRVMAGRRNRHPCRPLGELTLKGLPDPVEAVEVLWEPLAGAEPDRRVPLPGHLNVRPDPALVGREVELARVAEAAKRVAIGQGREILLVSGEAGLGKTTLVAEAARGAFDEGFLGLFGHCEEDLAAPYQLFAEALGHYVAHAPEERLRAHVEAHGSELLPLVPSLADRVPDLPASRAADADAERFLLFAAVVGLLAGASEDQPVVLVLDDLQWADGGSLLLLRHLAASELAMRVLVLGTYRDSDLSHASALVETLAALRRQRGVSRLELSGLDDLGVIALMEAASGQTLDERGVGLAHAISRETDGNPFFVGEVLRHLAETGAVHQDGSGRWVAVASLADTSLPDGVREVIGARVVRLGAEAEGILALAAVIGRDFDLDLLVASAQLPEEVVLGALEAARAVALVRELDDLPGRYSFTHALIQRTVYEDLGPTRRNRAHRRVAEALEELYGDRPEERVGDLARHWFSATQAQDMDKALEYSGRAADAALASLAPGDALRYYTQALGVAALIPDPPASRVLDLTIGLGTAQRQMGRPEFRTTLLGAAHQAAEQGDTERLVAAALANDRGVGIVGAVDADKVEVLELALTRLPDGHPDRALLLATLCSEMAFRSSLDDRMALADEAVAIAEASGDDVMRVRVLNHIVLPFHAPQLLETSLARSADALERAERTGDPVLVFVSAVARQIIAVSTGDIDEVDRCLAVCDSLVTRLGQPTLSCVHAVQQSVRAQVAGDPDRAEAAANLALQIGTESGEPDITLLFGSLFMGAQWQRGTVGQLVPIIEQAAADNPGLRALGAALAVASLESGDTEKARRLLEQAALQFGPPSAGAWLSEMCVYSEVAVACRMVEMAAVLFGHLAPWAGQFSASGLTAEGPVSHYLGGLAETLGRTHEAELYYARSSEMSVRMGASFFAARTHLRWGSMLAGQPGSDQAARARDLLSRAHLTALERGYGSVERRAAEALQALAG
jgi:class 3 adenylate cyclase